MGYENPLFLGYVKVKKAPTCFADFLAQHFMAKESELKEDLQVQIKDKAPWTQLLTIEIEGKEIPQRYTFASLLGAGQDGYVVKVLPEDGSNPIVALKMFRSGYSPSNDLSIQKEIAARKLILGNRADLLSQKEQDISGMRTLVMEFVEGPTLGQFLLEGKRTLSLSAARAILRPIFDICSMLKLYDLTRDNIMLKLDGESHIVKLIDFSKWEYGSTFSEVRKRDFFINLVRDVANLVPLVDRSALLSEFKLS